MRTPRTERVFMVRMWLPDGKQPPQEWRGSVRDIGADRTFYVVGTREIADYIAGALATSEPPKNRSS